MWNTSLFSESLSFAINVVHPSLTLYKLVACIFPQTFQKGAGLINLVQLSIAFTHGGWAPSSQRNSIRTSLSFCSCFLYLIWLFIPYFSKPNSPSFKYHIFHETSQPSSWLFFQGTHSAYATCQLVKNPPTTKNPQLDIVCSWHPTFDITMALWSRITPSRWSSFWYVVTKSVEASRDVAMPTSVIHPTSSQHVGTVSPHSLTRRRVRTV